MTEPTASRAYACSFCGKPRTAVKQIIAGPGGVFICNECVDLCYEIVHEHETTPPAGDPAGTTE